MRIKIPLYKQGFLNPQQLDQVQQHAEKLVLADMQIPEAIQDIEMTVYLRWLLKWVNQLNESETKNLEEFLRANPNYPNPILAYLSQKFTQTKLAADIPEILKQVLLLQNPLPTA